MKTAAGAGETTSRIRGMTGFGRAQGEAAFGAWVWETRSVNGKALDARVSVPPGHDAVDFEARRRLRERFSRGSFQLQLRIDVRAQPGAGQMDARLVARLARQSRGWSRAGLEPARLDGLFAVPGVLRDVRRAGGPDEAALAELMAGLDRALDALDTARRREGEALASVFAGLIASMRTAHAGAEAAAGDQPRRVREKLETRLAEIASGLSLDRERLAQEAALTAARSDVREELDRLSAHFSSAEALLAEGGAAGRKLDFLCQELNREANTLCSKSASLELTNHGLALKALIDQFREQAQNVE
jgi:uncharacterized protein (TIGR00255 family)